MGSRRKLVLASLLSLMMVLAFVVGLVPSHMMLSASAAGGSSGRVDMVDLLDAVLNLNAEKAATAIFVDTPKSGTVFKVPVDTDQSWLVMQSGTIGDGADVLYGVDGDWLIDDWSVYSSGGATPPYRAAIEMSPLYGVETTHWIYGFANATVVNNMGRTYFEYSVRSTGEYDGGFVTSSKIDLVLVDGESDADNNGIVDNLDEIGPFQVWQAAYATPLGGWRQVTITSLEPTVPGKEGPAWVTVDPNMNLRVMAPSLEQLGDVVAPEETAYLIVESAFELVSMVDSIDGSTDLADLAEWLAAVEATEPPGGMVPDAPIVGVTLLAAAGETYREIHTLPEGTGVYIWAGDMLPPANRNFGVWSYPLSVVDRLYGAGLQFTNNQDETVPDEWTFQGLYEFDPAQNMFTIGVNSLSMFAPFRSTMQFDAMYDEYAPVNDQTGPVDTAVLTAIIGEFGYFENITAANVATAFAVYFWDGDVGLGFGDFSGLPGLEVQEDNQWLWLRTPVVLNPTTAIVRLYDLQVAPDYSVWVDIPGGFTFTAYYTLDVYVDPPDAGAVAVDPDITRYPAGMTVTLTADPIGCFQFDHWEGDVADPTSPVTTVLMDADKAVTAVFVPLAEYTLTTLVSPDGGGTVDVSEPGPYCVGTVVTITAVPTLVPEYAFDHWEGDVADPTSPVTTVLMDTDKTVTAVFVRVIPQYTLTVEVEPPGAGAVAVDPLLATYPENTPVQLAASPAGCFEFDHWEVNTELAGSNPVLGLIMDGNKTVTAVFAALPEYSLSITIDPVDGGDVNLSAAGPYCVGTVVQLTAVPNTGYNFFRWEGDVSDLYNPVTTIVMDADKSVTAYFVLGLPPPVVTDITPSDVWVFGGVRARVDGAHFQEGARVSIVPDGDIPAIEGIVPIDVTPTAIYFIVPSLGENITQQSVNADVLVENPEGDDPMGTLPDGLTYWHYRTAEGITTTAFIQTGDVFDVALDSDPTAAALTLPPIGADKSVGMYGLVRSSKNAEDVLADLIDPIPTDSDPMTGRIDNIWEFEVHLYDSTIPVEETANTSPLGVALYPELPEDQTVYAKEPGVTPATLSFPVDDTSLTAADVRMGLTLWSMDTLFDYGMEANAPAEDASTEYQSTVTAGEVGPDIDGAPDGTEIDSVVARIYDFSAFSLRSGVAFLPGTVKDGMQLDEAFGAGTSTFAGQDDEGNPVQARIISPEGGLAWVRIAFGENITDTTPITAAGLVEVTDFVDLGNSEFQVTFNVPAYPDPNPDPQDDDDEVVADIAIYLANDLSKPIRILDGDWLYYDPPAPSDKNWLWALLALLAALLGLAAGGDSGGGDGGPCFIATAAYGTPMAPDIETLRAFRDAFLLDSSVGTAFVDTYYRISPFMADLIARSPILMAAARVMLLPIILAVRMPAVTMALVSFMAMLASVKRFVRRRRS